MSQNLFPTENSSPAPINLNPTIFSVGRPVGGANPSSFLSTDSNGYLTTSFATSSLQPLDATLTALSQLNSDTGALFQTGADTFTKKNFFGTANEIIITETASGLTFATPQDIGTTNSPTFAGLTLTSFASGRILFTGAGGVLTTNGVFTIVGNQMSLLQQGSAGGILFGGDALLYRGAADALRTPDSLIIDSGLAVGQTSTTARATIAQTDGVNYALHVRHTGGSATRNALFVESSGTGTNTTAVLFSTSTAPTGFIMNGLGQIGINQAPETNTRLALTSAGATSAFTALMVRASGGGQLLAVRSDGGFRFGAGTITPIQTGYTPSNTNYSALRTLGFDFTGVTASDANFRLLARMVETMARDLVAKGIISV